MSAAPPRIRTEALAERLLAGERAALARAITLIESARSDHQWQAQDLLRLVLPHTGKADRIGITGVPGVGKSTFIEALGKMLLAKGHRVAVLAVDPTSTRTGGSILGDKTRMTGLATDPSAFVRPSPSSGSLGGVARTTRETGLLCEAAGYDVVLVETVGVGQSETAVAAMVDLFLVLMLPGAGDELQGIKKGLIEIADLIAVNKADGQSVLAAEQARRHYRSALQIVAPQHASWRADVLTISALTGAGLPELWDAIGRFRHALKSTGELAAKRRIQQVDWLDRLLRDRLDRWLRDDEAASAELATCRREVANGQETPWRAVERVLAAFAPPQKPKPKPTPTLLP